MQTVLSHKQDHRATKLPRTLHVLLLGQLPALRGKRGSCTLLSFCLGSRHACATKRTAMLPAATTRRALAKASCCADTEWRYGSMSTCSYICFWYGMHAQGMHGQQLAGMRGCSQASLCRRPGSAHPRSRPATPSERPPAAGAPRPGARRGSPHAAGPRPALPQAPEYKLRLNITLN